MDMVLLLVTPVGLGGHTAIQVRPRWALSEWWYVGLVARWGLDLDASGSSAGCPARFVRSMLVAL